MSERRQSAACEPQQARHRPAPKFAAQKATRPALVRLDRAPSAHGERTLQLMIQRGVMPIEQPMNRQNTSDAGPPAILHGRRLIDAPGGLVQLSCSNQSTHRCGAAAGREAKSPHRSFSTKRAEYRGIGAATSFIGGQAATFAGPPRAHLEVGPHLPYA